MEKSANIKYLRISPKKVRFLISDIKGRMALAAMDALSVENLKKPRVILSALKSAVNQFPKADWDKLVIKNITVDKGPLFKRWRPGGRGMAKKYSKKTSHLMVTLSLPEAKVAKVEPKQAKAVAPKEVKKTVKKLIKKENGK